MMKPKHIFFDLDHTLWDFEKNSTETLSALFDEFKLGQQIDNKERFLATYQTVNAIYWKKYRNGKIDKETVRYGRFSSTLERFKIDDAHKLGKEIADEYIKIGPHKTHLFPNVHETLTYLKANYPLHIITNGFKEVQRIKLSGSNLTQYFNHVICSEDVGVNKPNRKVFDYALKLAKTSAVESLMIGDNLEADIKGAEKAGMTAILFDPKKEHKSVKSRVIHDLIELKKML